MRRQGYYRMKERKISKRVILDLLEMAPDVRAGLSIQNMEMLLEVNTRQDESILISTIQNLYENGRIVKFKGVCSYIGCVTTLYRIKLNQMKTNRRTRHKRSRSIGEIMQELYSILIRIRDGALIQWKKIMNERRSEYDRDRI